MDPSAAEELRRLKTRLAVTENDKDGAVLLVLFLSPSGQPFDRETCFSIVAPSSDVLRPGKTAPGVGVGVHLSVHHLSDTCHRAVRHRHLEKQRQIVPKRLKMDGMS